MIEGSPWVMAITGIGGIGKTSLVHSVVKQLVQQFRYEEVIWLQINYRAHQKTIKNTNFDEVLLNLAHKVCPDMVSETSSLSQIKPYIRQALKAIPALVIVDNLEAEADTANLLSYFQDLANPSKFILTTRTFSTGQAGTYNLPVPQLSLAPATQLIRDHAQEIGLESLAKAPTDEDAESIFSITGGNPLALKLVVSLATVLPLPHILDDLIKVQTNQVENMYRHIYWKIWHTLSENGRTLLTMMPMATNMGIKLKQIEAISHLETDQLWPAIIELVNRSLLEVRGDHYTRRYSIHRLTETFLHTEIIHWPEEE